MRIDDEGDEVLGPAVGPYADLFMAAYHRLLALDDLEAALAFADAADHRVREARARAALATAAHAQAADVARRFGWSATDITSLDEIARRHPSRARSLMLPEDARATLGG